MLFGYFSLTRSLLERPRKEFSEKIASVYLVTKITFNFLLKPILYKRATSVTVVCQPASAAAQFPLSKVTALQSLLK